MALTPMMQQYMDIKKDYTDSILFFRLGDFYEMFFEDAKIASKEMEVTLTGKSCGLEERAPMCGVPYHAADIYIAKLVEKGYKVAICEQVEDPATAKGIVKREVVRVITPGTAMNSTLLEEGENNYLAVAYIDESGAGSAFCDLSTGEIGVAEFSKKGFFESLQNELIKLSAKEILIFPAGSGYESELLPDLKNLTGGQVSVLDSSYCSRPSAEERILSQFRVKALKGIGLEERPLSVMALGALLTYLFETQKQSLTHIRKLKIADLHSFMSLDKATIKNLELTETLFEKKIHGSLLGVLDKTRTAMGSRKMKQWLREPLNQVKPICERLDAVEKLVEDILLRNDLREHLKQIYDLERLTGRVAYGTANGKDLISLRNSIAAIPDIKETLKGCGNSLLERLEGEMDDLKAVCTLIDKSIVEEPPFTIREGGLIRAGYSAELDQLKDSIRDGQLWIAGLEETERNRTGIKNLKVGFNKVFGYYIEVTKSNYSMVPEDYIRKQTLVNCERFITPELKEVESVVLNAETKINQLEYELFQGLREELQNFIGFIQTTSAAIGVLDVLLSFAEVGSRQGYVKPVVDHSDAIQIEKGRHPVLEQLTRDGIFVSNDLYMDRSNQSMLLITGPNMSGKSTYMRQTALIVLMAQAGCFVPAEQAKIGLVDRIYTRIGASDNLAQGQSTFFVEMSELAYILNTATEKSLIILDEIGRGTSTYDGLSIAWSVVEYLCHPHWKVRTLFATHYHELTVLEDHIKGVKNLNVDVQEQSGNIVFLHKIAEGSTSRSYGIHVAKLAGVPSQVLETAREKLFELEGNSSELSVSQYNKVEETENTPAAKQLSLFDFVSNPVLERLKALDLMELTPSRAFEILEELKHAAEQ
ncbi:MAG: DNA mismatch repair protein MutS [Anaerovoracaceae bacterium]